MSSIAARYDRLASRFAGIVRSVPADRWNAPSPCEEWTARDVVDHVVGNHGFFLGMVDLEVDAHPPAEEDPVAAVEVVTAQMRSVLADPALAERTYDGMFGTRTLEWGVDQFLCDDLVVHGWDLARATGGDESIDPAEIEVIRAHTETWGDAMRGPGAMGPALDPPEGADDATKLLAFLGRKAW